MLQPTLNSQACGYYYRVPPVLSVEIWRHFTEFLSVTESMFSSGKRFKSTLENHTIDLFGNFLQYFLAVLWKGNLVCLTGGMEQAMRDERTAGESCALNVFSPVNFCVAWFKSSAIRA